MRREKRKTIAIRDGEVRVYETEYAAAKDLGVRVQSVQAAKRWNCISGNDWEIYDEPKKIRERIAELEEQIKMLKKYGFEG